MHQVGRHSIAWWNWQRHPVTSQLLDGIASLLSKNCVRWGDTVGWCHYSDGVWLYYETEWLRCGIGVEAMWAGVVSGCNVNSNDSRESSDDRNEVGSGNLNAALKQCWQGNWSFYSFLAKLLQGETSLWILGQVEPGFASPASYNDSKNVEVLH